MFITNFVLFHFRLICYIQNHFNEYRSSIFKTVQKNTKQCYKINFLMKVINIANTQDMQTFRYNSHGLITARPLEWVWTVTLGAVGFEELTLGSSRFMVIRLKLSLRHLHITNYERANKEPKSLQQKKSGTSDDITSANNCFTTTFLL